MGKEREFDALASDAIASTEKELFAEAFGQAEEANETSEAGDRSLETMGSGLEGQHESDEEDDDGQEGETPEAEAEAEAEADGDGSVRDEQGRFKPKGEEQTGKAPTAAEAGLRKEMLAEREKRQAAETELSSYKDKLVEMDRRFATLEGRLAQAAQSQQPQPKVEASKEEIPDRWMDPEGYERWQRDQIRREFRSELQATEQRRVAASFEDARATHGRAFDDAFQAADALPKDNPLTKQFVDSIMQAPNPAARLMSWHKQQLAAREIGADPNAYRERVIAEQREALMKDPEFRKQVLAQLQGEARGGRDGGPRTTTQLPPSLSSARGGSVGRAPSGGLSDSELFDEVMT